MRNPFSSFMNGNQSHKSQQQQQQGNHNNNTSSSSSNNNNNNIKANGTFSSTTTSASSTRKASELSENGNGNGIGIANGNGIGITNGNGNGYDNSIECYRHQVGCHFHQVQAIPPLPPIKSSVKPKRLEPLSVQEYERQYMDEASDLGLIERIFYGGMGSNQLRAALWPYLFGLVKHKGRFKRVTDDNNITIDYVYDEHEKNVERWQELDQLYKTYSYQWQSIQPDQELRFTIFRERKSLIERDVIRSDRSHPFYADNSRHSNALTNLLMTYMMYDFDIGYLQGMSDIAAPILYIFNGDLIKSFWVFVEVMKLFRGNFEYSQKSIHFQLNCLFRLIKLTDSNFAQYLIDNDCSNCFFTFRCIVCKFKREIMRPAKDSTIGYSQEDSDNERSTTDNHYQQDYGQVLNLWDTIWSVQRRHELIAKDYYVHTFTIAKNGNKTSKSSRDNNNYTNGTTNVINYHKRRRKQSLSHVYQFHQSQTDVPRFDLTETEKFILSLCLSLIRRQRNYIMQHQLDSTEIHQHFIEPNIGQDLDTFIESAYHIYHYLNSDCNMQLVVKEANELDVCGGLDLTDDDDENGSPKADAADTFDLLKDYLIISPTSYSKHYQNHSPPPPPPPPQQPTTATTTSNVCILNGIQKSSWDQFANNDIKA